jgi:hypothetical protein
MVSSSRAPAQTAVWSDLQSMFRFFSQIVVFAPLNIGSSEEFSYTRMSSTQPTRLVPLLTTWEVSTSCTQILNGRTIPSCSTPRTRHISSCSAQERSTPRGMPGHGTVMSGECKGAVFKLNHLFPLGKNNNTVVIETDVRNTSRIINV